MSWATSTAGGKDRGHERPGQVSGAQGASPLAEVLTYAPNLTSMTSGRGTYTMSFSHMEPVPYNIQEKIVAEVKAARDGK